MDHDEALGVLGLSPGASRAEIEAAFRGAMKVAHPDSGPDSDEAAARRLNEAREKALEALQPSTALVPVEVRDLVRAATYGQSQVAKANAADKAVRQVVLHHIGELAQIRRRRTAAAALSGGIAAVLVVMRLSNTLVPESRIQQILIGVAIATLSLAAAVLGCWAWLVSSRETLLELRIEEAAETLADKATVMDSVAEIALSGTWSRAELIEGVRAWIQRHEQPDVTLASGAGSIPLVTLAADIGAVDFARLLTAKGLESGIIEEYSGVDSQGRPHFGFRLALPPASERRSM
jgi:hypothetical protein